MKRLWLVSVLFLAPGLSMCGYASNRTSSSMNLTDFVVSVTAILGLIVTLGTLAFYARRYVRIRTKEQKQDDFRVYHDFIKHISRGEDEQGRLKLVSQLAYIYELRNFPEYGELTPRLLEKLRSEWEKNDPHYPNNEVLAEAIKETVTYLQK